MRSRRFSLLTPITLVTLLMTACGPGAEVLEVNLQGSGLAADSNPHERYVVQFKRGARNHVTRGLSAVRGEGGQVVLDLTARYGAVAARLPEAAAVALARNPHVEYVELDPKRYPVSFAPDDDKEYENSPNPPYMPYGTQMVQADLVTADPANIDDVMICIIDTGLAVFHSDASTNASGYDGDSSLPWDEDGDGHGTHVAGTIAGLQNGSGIRGVLPGARLHIVRVFADDGYWAYSSDLADAITKCTDAAAAAGTRLVISMSLGGDKPRGRPSVTVVEENACNAAWDAGALLVAAAGNDGKRPNIKPSYPASYDAVISVAAVDYTGTTASFSQENEQVELSAPGVDVLSSVPHYAADLTVDGTGYTGTWVIGSARTQATGPLVDGGYCPYPPTGDWSGKVVICDYYAGTSVSSWYDKFANVEAAGGVGVVLYYSSFPAYAALDTRSPLPGVLIGPTDAASLIASHQGESATVNVDQISAWERWDGTSMATPHVSGVAGLVWTFDDRWSNQQLRDALAAGASDLGSAGRDETYGFGLVQAKGALDAISGCVGNGFCNETCDFDPDCCPNYPNCPDPFQVVTVKGAVSVDLSQITCGTQEVDNCAGYLAVVVTESNVSPYQLILGDFQPNMDLNGPQVYNYEFQVEVTGGPMYLWAFMWETPSPDGYFYSGDLLSPIYDITPTGPAEIVRNLSLDHREP